MVWGIFAALNIQPHRPAFREKCGLTFIRENFEQAVVLNGAQLQPGVEAAPQAISFDTNQGVCQAAVRHLAGALFLLLSTRDASNC
jgi:hypothetical protein